MKYQKVVFSVPVGESDAYRLGWERIFGKGREAVDEGQEALRKGQDPSLGSSDQISEPAV